MTLKSWKVDQKTMHHWQMNFSRKWRNESGGDCEKDKPHMLAVGQVLKFSFCLFIPFVHGEISPGPQLEIIITYYVRFEDNYESVLR